MMDDSRQSLLADLRGFRGFHLGACREPNARPMQSGSQWKYFRAWRQSLNRKTPLDDQRPWMTFSAIEEQERLLPVDSIFEWGSGGSTLFYRKRAKRVVTVEHDQEYFNLVTKRLADVKGDHEYHWIPPTEESGEQYQSHMSPGCFRDYVRFIDRFDDESFDLVCVDGRARVRCVEAAAAKIKPGGHLVLDNSERLVYKAATDILGTRWSQDRFAGCGPYNRYFWETTIFGKPK